MKLILCCLAAALISSASSAAVVDVEKTVQQVQNILQTNSQLPRLTRDEIIQLLNDIKAEDAKNSASKESKEIKSADKVNNDAENEIFSTKESVISIKKEKDLGVFSSTTQSSLLEIATKKVEPTVMVVLPYTPRDGSSLQELYTKPPRTEVVPESQVTPKSTKTKLVTSNERLQESLKSNAKLANQKKEDFPTELQEFLDAHGLKGESGKENFLLPLDGFKPLPPAKVVDGTVQLPENILLTYDLISPVSDLKESSYKSPAVSDHQFMFEPLPYELDTSSSDNSELVLPLDLPKSRKTKSTTSPKKNYEPIDYDAVKVIPLKQGKNPLEDEDIIIDSEQNKRQANQTSEAESTTDAKVETTSEEGKDSVTSAPAASNDSAASETDSGASISDLEASFGGAAPEEPGDSQLPPPKKNGFYWLLDWNSFLEVGDGDSKVNIRFEPKLGDPQMFLPVNVP